MSDKQHMQLVPSADWVESDGMLFVCVSVCVIILLYFFYSLAANVAIWVNILHVNLHVIAKY